MSPSSLPRHKAGELPFRQVPGRVRLVTDALETPSLDDRSYRVIQLENELEAILIHDPKADKAGAAMDVNVGNFSDDPNIPGMAHAVEHLLFMGTKKYPGENDYAQYLTANSGSSNAYTSMTSTNFHFEIAAKPPNDEDPSEQNPSPLHGALDRFAQFFTEPLFLESSLDRELLAVDSEHKKNLQNDTWRLGQLDKSLANPNHPYRKFATGTLELLKTIPESKGINVRDKFIEFHSRHYSANRMKLAILGREPLDLLEKWTADLFSAVPNKKLTPNRWEDEVPYRASELGVQCFAKPVMDSRELNLVFPFLNDEKMFDSQPSRQVSHLIGHEGPGSIMAYIKAKGWANGLSAGSFPLCPGSPSLFECQIRLTEEGLEHYKDIIVIFFQYVAMLKEKPPQRWLFEEQKGIAEVDFKFRQKAPATRFVMRTSSLMQQPIPREWLISGQSRLRTFNPDLIQKAIDCLRPDNFRLTIISQNFPGTWDKREPWYGTEYKLEKIPADFMEELKKAAAAGPEERLSALHLPHRNNFIPTKLDVEKKEVDEPAVAPVVLRNDELARTWWKKDDTFWVPKANLLISFKSPIIFATQENCVKARLFTDLVRDALEEYSYDAELAGLQYNVSIDSRGLYMELSGYNDKLAVLLEQVLKTMKELTITDERFEIVKERLKRGYNNWELQSSFQQIGNYTYWLTSERDFLVEELAAQLPSVTAEATRQFQRQLLSQLYTEVYVHGNVYREEALTLTTMVEKMLRPRELPPSLRPIRRSLILPWGSNYTFQKTLKDRDTVNHCIEYWLLTGDKGNRSIRTKTLLLDQMVHEPAYDQLRTKEQLGYVVFSGARGFATTYGFRWLVQSERSPQYLESRIIAFIDYLAGMLEEMTEEDFARHKRSLIVRRLKKLENLAAESNRHWSQITGEYYDFAIAQQDAETIRTITKADMMEFFNEFISNKSASRAKLAVHLYARGNVQSQQALDDVVERLEGEADETKDAVRVALLEPALRDNMEALRAFLDGLNLAEDKVAMVTAAAQDAATAPKTPEDSSKNDSAPFTALPETVYIRDIRAFKQSLQVSSGAQPVKDITEYEEIDSKL